MTTETVPEVRTPDLFEVVALNEDGYEHLPKPKAPYFVVAREDWFLHKATQIGVALLPMRPDPTKLGRIGYAKGTFTWEGDKVPGAIISQAHDFFARIFGFKHSEAEVLITKHNDTGEFRLFVPYQRVSHMGVKSIYDPTHIDPKYTVVGTIHSHCDFGAFHSGTDTGDASDMDGVHFTIGKVNTTPEIAAMVMMNGNQFDYSDVSTVADVEYKTATAPPWWDRYVFHEGNAPTVKPAGLTGLTQAHWDEFLGRALHKPKVHVVSSPSFHKGSGKQWTPSPGFRGYAPSPSTWGRDKDGPVYSQRTMSDDYDWRKDVYGGGYSRDDFTSVSNTALPEEMVEDDRIIAALEEAEKADVFSEWDWENVKLQDANDLDFWRGFFLNRAAHLNTVLRLLAVEVNCTAKYLAPAKKGKKK